MPLLRGLSRAHRERMQVLEEERIRRAGEEMRTAPLPYVPAQPGRGKDTPTSHRAALPQHGNQVAAHRVAIEPVRAYAGAAVSHAEGGLLTYRWDNLADLLRRVPQQRPPADPSTAPLS